MTEARCNLLWIGPRLGRVERACLRSCFARAIRSRSYCYQPARGGCPKASTLRDAAEILPSGQHRPPSERQRRALRQLVPLRAAAPRRGIWLDADIVSARAAAGRSVQPVRLAGSRASSPPECCGCRPIAAAAAAARFVRRARTCPRLARAVTSGWRAWLRRAMLDGAQPGFAACPAGSAGRTPSTALAMRHGLAGEATAASRPSTRSTSTRPRWLLRAGAIA